MNRIVYTAASLSLALLVSCAASGVRVTEAQLASLTKGRTTMQDVVASFGPPTMRTRAADGTTLLQYVYSEAKVRPASFIPLVGAFAGGTDLRSNVATLRFDGNGLLLDVASSETEMGTGVGASAGAVNPQPVPQPRQ